jgi:hypothetical protein
MGLPEPNELYLAHVHPGSCEDEEHSDAPESETADYHSHEYGHEEHADAQVQEENYEATADGFDYPLTPVESNAAGEGSSTTVSPLAPPSETGKALRCTCEALVGYRGGEGGQWYGHRGNDRTPDPLSPRVRVRDQIPSHSPHVYECLFHDEG